MVRAKAKTIQPLVTKTAAALALGLALSVMGAVSIADGAPLEEDAVPVAQKAPNRSASCTGTGATTGLVFADLPELCPILAESGSARLERYDDGQQYIVGTINGLNYGLDVYNCDPQCADMSFSASFTLDGVTMERMNEWNRTQRFGTAYLDEEGDAWILWTVNTRFGIPAETFRDDIVWWSSIMDNFANHIGFR